MQAKTKLGNEGEIQKLIENWENSLRARDIDGLLEAYSPDFVGYDAIPPLQSKLDVFRKGWGEFYEMFPGEVNIERRDQNIRADEKLGFSYALVAIGGTTKDGKKEHGWMRQTTTYEKPDGKWLITHEHWSLPVDMKTMQGLTDLKP